MTTRIWQSAKTEKQAARFDVKQCEPETEIMELCNSAIAAHLYHPSGIKLGSQRKKEPMPSSLRRILWTAIALIAAPALTVGAAFGAEPQGFLETIHRHIMRTSTVADNGDLNPYAIVIAPVSIGKVQKDDVLVTNFNNVSNLQGTGGTIVDYNPSTKKTTLFANLPQHLPQCPGGVGLGTAMTMLKTGWVIGQPRQKAPVASSS